MDFCSAALSAHTSSGHEADSLTCDHLSNCPSYCQNNPYNDETFDESFHTGDYLFIWSYWNNIGTTLRKAPTFLWGLLQFDLRLERRTRFELATFCLEGRCSANWATTANRVQCICKLIVIIQLNKCRWINYNNHCLTDEYTIQFSSAQDYRLFPTCYSLITFLFM